jgi:serralysin
MGVVSMRIAHSHNPRPGKGRNRRFGGVAVLSAALLAIGMVDAAPAATAVTNYLRIYNASITEGNANRTVNVKVQLSSTPTQRTTVYFRTVNGTAKAPADYAAKNTTVVFPVGVRTKLVPLTIKGDLLDEAAETFGTRLSSPIGARIARGAGVVTIYDNDPLPRVSVADVQMDEENSGAATMAFPVTLSAKSGRTVSVSYTITPGSATPGVDYSLIDPASGKLVFPAGTLAKSLRISVIGDTTDEVNETVNVVLIAPVSCALSHGSAVGTIRNDDGPGIAINNTSATEGNTANFTLTIPSASPNVITVDYTTANGTAIAGSDYTLTAGTATFPAGTTIQTITVPTTNDATDEQDEYFYVNLSNPTNSTIGDSQGYAYIDDNDGPNIVINDRSFSEGDGTPNVTYTFTVSLSSSSPQTVSVNYATANGTATAGSDYQTASGTLVFTPGQTSKTVDITETGDLTVENSETFAVNLSSAVDGTIAHSQGVGTIVNDDVTSTDEGYANATYMGSVSGDTTSASISYSSTILLGDSDWYRVTLREDSHSFGSPEDLLAAIYLTVAENPAQSSGDIDMAIYKANGTTFVGSATHGGTTDEQYNVKYADDAWGFFVDPDGDTTFYVKVYGYGSVMNNYTLTVYGDGTYTGVPIGTL